MDRFRRRFLWITVPLLLIIPLVLAACGGSATPTPAPAPAPAPGLTEEDAARIAEEAAMAAAESAAMAVDEAVQMAMASVPEPPPGLTAADVATEINRAIAQIPEGLTAAEVSEISQGVAEQVAAGGLSIDEVQAAIAMELAESARMAAEEEAEAAMMMEDQRLRDLYASVYQGNTLRLLVGFSAGGGYDTYGRAIARHIGKHIPGNPDVVVENMTGAGSLVAANHLYNQADPNGLVMGLWNSNHLFIAALADDPEAEGILFDASKFGWLGAPSDGNPVCAIMGFVGTSDANELLAPGTTYKHGATAAVGGSLSDIPRLTNAFVGTDHEIVSGYRGTARVRLGLQGGEVDAACWGWESMGVTARSMLDAEGDDQFIPYAMVFPSDDPEISDLPLLGDFISDPANKALYDIWAVGYRFQRPWTTPPDTADPLVEILQQAFADTMADPEFIADAQSAGLYLNPQTGDDIEAWVDEILGISPEDKEALQFLVKVGEE